MVAMVFSEIAPLTILFGKILLITVLECEVIREVVNM